MNQIVNVVFFLFIGINVWAQSAPKKFTRDFYFASGSAELDSIETKKALVLVKILSKFELTKIEIIGYTDSDGSAQSNLSLSEKRIKTVQKYYWEFVPDSLLILLPKGEEDPVFENLESTKHKNRRVRVKAYYSKKKSKPIRKKKESPEVNIEELVEGNVIDLPAVQFYGGTAEFLPGATTILNKVIPVLKANPELKIEIAGHICCGNQMELSIDRAFVVYTYFIDRGVPSKMLTYKGYNNTQPKYGNLMDARNRRVELIVLK